MCLRNVLRKHSDIRAFMIKVIIIKKAKEEFMRILVISDTHGVCDRVYEVYRKLTKQNPVDYIVHCGDYCKDAEEIRMRLGVPVASVRGNCDGGFEDTDFSILETEAGNFLITHGHMQNVDLSMQNLYYKALENDCVGALFGHTHRAVYTQVDDVYLMNPGSLSRPRDGSGGTFGLLITDEEGVWGKIYRYEDFMAETGGSRVAALSGAAGTTDANPAAGAAGTTDANLAAGAAGTADANPAAGAAGKTDANPAAGAAGTADANPAVDAAGIAPAHPKKKPKAKGGHLRELLNYSDRF